MRYLKLLPLLAIGCDGIGFTVDQSAKSTIEGAGVLGDLLSTFDLGDLDDFDVSIDQELADQGVDPGDLTSLYLTELRLEASDLSFIDTLSISVEAKGIAPVRIAHLENFEGSSVQLELDEVDLVDLVVAGEMHFSADANGSPPADDTELTVYIGVQGYATAQGACHQLKK